MKSTTLEAIKALSRIEGYLFTCDEMKNGNELADNIKILMSYLVKQLDKDMK